MKILLICITLLYAIPSLATTYYIDPSCGTPGDGTGADGICDGTAADNPLSGIKSGSLTWDCGNIYKWKAGTTDTVHDNTDLDGTSFTPSGCSAVSYIELTSYGAGADPIITYFQEYDAWDSDGTWSDDSGTCTGCWYADPSGNSRALDHTVSTTNYWPRIFLDGVEYPNAPSASEIDGVTYLWYIDTSSDANHKRLHLYSGASKPSLVYSDISYFEGNFIFDVNDLDYLVMHDLDIRASNSAFDCINCDYGTFYDNSIYGFKCDQNGSNDPCEYNEIYTNIIDTKQTVNILASQYWQGSDTIYFDGGQYNKIYHNQIGNAAHNAIYLDSTGDYTGGESGETGCIGNEAYENYIYWDNTTADYGRAWTTGGYCDGNIFIRNYIDHQWARSQVGGTGNVIAYNIWDTVLQNSSLCDDSFSGNCRGQALNFWINQSQAPANNVIANNVFYNIAEPCFYIGASTGSGNSFTNNVFYECGVDSNDAGDSPPSSHWGVASDLAIFLVAGATNTTFNNNIFYNSSPDYGECGAGADENCILKESGGSWYALSNWNVTDGCSGCSQANNLASDPKFTNAASAYFTLLAQSPAIDSGIDVTINGLCTASGKPWSCCSASGVGTCNKAFRADTDFTSASNFINSVQATFGYPAQLDGLGDIGAIPFPKYGGE